MDDSMDLDEAAGRGNSGGGGQTFANNRSQQLHFDTSHFNQFDTTARSSSRSQFSRQQRGRGRGARGGRPAFNPHATRNAFNAFNAFESPPVESHSPGQQQLLTQDGRNPFETTQRFGNEAQDSPAPFGQPLGGFGHRQSRAEVGNNLFTQREEPGSGNNTVSDSSSPQNTYNSQPSRFIAHPAIRPTPSRPIPFEERQAVPATPTAGRKIASVGEKWKNRHQHDPAGQRAPGFDQPHGSSGGGNTSRTLNFPPHTGPQDAGHQFHTQPPPGPRAWRENQQHHQHREAFSHVAPPSGGIHPPSTNTRNHGGPPTNDASEPRIKGSETAEAKNFYGRLEEYRRNFASAQGLFELPEFERTKNSAGDLLKAINETEEPYLEFSRLWEIFHEGRNRKGFPSFVPYAQLEQLIDPIASAIRVAKAEKRGQQDINLTRQPQQPTNEPKLKNLFDGLNTPVQPFKSPDSAKTPNTNQLGLLLKQYTSPVGRQTQSNEARLEQASMSSPTRTVDQFLIEVRGLVRNQDAEAIAKYLVIEPPFAPPYELLIKELRQFFPKGEDEMLENKCEGQLNSNRDEQWPAFSRFIAQYFAFMRDLDASDLLATFLGLNSLIQSCNTAFGHPTHGGLLIAIILYYSRVLARLAIGLDKHPELTFTTDSAAAAAEEGEGTTLPERAANTIRDALISCIRDRSPGPEGKWRATIKLANICLKILFQSGRVERSTQIFQNLNTFTQSHPLSQFSKADRVTFHYYAGMASFVVSQFYNASQLLEKAYLECHVEAAKQRRLILVPLVVANLIQGRFPSQELLHRTDAVGLRETITPLCRAIKLGDVESFRRLTAFGSPTAQWLLRHRVLLQIRDGCEMLVWRGLFRRTFLLSGNPAKMNEQGRQLTPWLDLHTVAHIARYLERRALNEKAPAAGGGPGNRNLNWIFMENDDTIPPSLKNQLVAAEFEGLTDPQTGRDLYRSPPASLLENRLPSLESVEATVASLIDQGFMNGYIARSMHRFAIAGARGKAGALPSQAQAAVVGFPSPWSVVKKVSKPQKQRVVNGARFGSGNVIRLSGARPAGA
jgi:nuclear mRNA export protein PCID2/THP1